MKSKRIIRIALFIAWLPLWLVQVGILGMMGVKPGPVSAFLQIDILIAGFVTIHKATKQRKDVLPNVPNGLQNDRTNLSAEAEAQVKALPGGMTSMDERRYRLNQTQSTIIWVALVLLSLCSAALGIYFASVEEASPIAFVILTFVMPVLLLFGFGAYWAGHKVEKARPASQPLSGSSDIAYGAQDYWKCLNCGTVHNASTPKCSRCGSMRPQRSLAEEADAHREALRKVREGDGGYREPGK